MPPMQEPLFMSNTSQCPASSSIKRLKARCDCSVPLLPVMLTLPICNIIIRLHPCTDVLAQAFLVEPRLGAVEVAHIEEAQDGLVFRAAVALHDQHMVLGRDADGDGVVQRGGRGMRQGPSGPHRNVSEVSVRETEAVEVPAKRSGAACPAGAVTGR